MTDGEGKNIIIDIELQIVCFQRIYLLVTFDKEKTPSSSNDDFVVVTQQILFPLDITTAFNSL